MAKVLEKMEHISFPKKFICKMSVNTENFILFLCMKKKKLKVDENIIFSQNTPKIKC